VIAGSEFFNSGHQVQVSDTYVVINLAMPCVYYAEPNSHAFADPVPETQPIKSSLQK